MRGFINVTTEAGPVVLGVAQIASIVPGGKRNQWSDIRMSNGQIFEAQVGLDRLLDLIDEATFEDESAPPPVVTASPPPEPTSPIGPPAEQLRAQAAQATPFVKEAKQRGRPPRATKS